MSLLGRALHGGHVGPQQSHPAVPRVASSSQRIPFLLPRATRALFSTMMTLGNLQPLLKCPFQGRWDNTKSTPLKPLTCSPTDVLVSIPPSSPAGMLGTGLPRLRARRLLAWLGLCPDPPPQPQGPWLAPGARDSAPRCCGIPRGQWPPPHQWWLGSPGGRECLGLGDKVPFQPEPWKDMCVCVCVCRG